MSLLEIRNLHLNVSSFEFCTCTFIVFTSFLQNCGNSTSATSWHYYTFYGLNATVDNFTDPSITEALIKQIYRVTRFIQTYRPYLPQTWIAETAGAFGGGAKGLSDAYVAGFLYVRRLNGNEIIWTSY